MNFLKKHGLKIIIWVVLVVSIMALAHRFIHIKKHFEFSIFLNVKYYWLVVLVFLLMLVNWTIEAIKWKLVTRHLQKISILDALKGVLMGLTVSLIMPNRTGEFIGKVLILDKENRAKGVLASMLSSISQLLMTLIFGVFGILFLYIKKISLFDKYFIFSVILLIIFALFYMFFPSLSRKWLRFLPDKMAHFLSFLTKYQLYDLGLLIAWSFVRYFVFILQLYLLFVFFGMPLNVIDFVLNASISFLLTTIIPTTSLTEIFVRNQVGLMLFEDMVMHDEIIVASFSSLWLINIAIPSIAGIIISIRHKT